MRTFNSTLFNFKKSCLLLLFAGFAALGFAQGPNNAYRLPVTPDMPDWARQLYRDDIEVNVHELDEAFEEWEQAYEAEHEGEREAAIRNGEDEGEFRENQWEEYYMRWRNAVRPFEQPDGSLLFDAKLLPKFEPQQGSIPESSTTWSLIGPLRTYFNFNDNAAQPLVSWQANIFSIAVAPSDPNTLLYGTATGLVGKSTDKGLTWTTVGLNYFVGPDMGATAIHPTNTSIFYVGDNTGVHTSTDGGASWSQALTVGGFNCNDIKIKPDNGDIVLAAGSSLRRRTAGNTWTTILSKLSYDIAFKPDDPNIVYVLVKTGTLTEFWKSTDGGQTFSIRSNGWITGVTDDGGGRLTVTPADNNRIYALLLTSGGPRVMRSDDAGETWTVKASSTQTGLVGPCTSGPLSMTNGQGFYDMSIVASHTNADHIIVATTTSFKSTDGGSTYATMGGYCGPIPIHPDIQEMLANGNDTWIVTDGGINYSTDFYSTTANHQARINGMGGSDWWGFDQGWNEDVQVGGRYHNGNAAHRESYPAGDYLRMGGGEAATGYLNPFNAGMAYYSDLGGRMLPATFSSPVTNFGVSKFPNEAYWEMENGEQEWDPRYAYTYYLGKDSIFWKTTDNGASFTPLFTYPNENAKVLHIEVSRTDPNIIYATVQINSPSPDDGELWKTTDGGTTWTQCANPTGPTAGQRRVSTIALSGTDANTLWWCFRGAPDGNKIFKSTDGGATWTNLTTATLNGVAINEMMHQLGTDGGVYISSNTGKVWYRNNSQPDWNLYNTGLPIALYSFPSVMRMKAYYKGGKLRMSTNKGIWEVDLYEPSATTLVQPMVDNAAPTCANDTLQLESYSVVNGAATYQWSFNPPPQWISNPNIRNPRVVLGPTAGPTAVSLVVTDANGSTGRTIFNFINNTGLTDACMCTHYCAASQTTGGCGATPDEHITNVTFGTIDNSSTCAQSLPAGYTDYTNISTAVNIGSSYTLNLTNGGPFGGDQCKAWFDWNANGDFNDAGEVYTLTSGDNISWTANITVPAGAVVGNTRMRVRVAYTGSIVPCGALQYGEAEDYCIIVNGCTTPPVVTAPTVTQPTCAVPNGTIVVNATGSNLEYSVNDGLTWQTSSTFSDLVAGNYNIKVRFQSSTGCLTAYENNPIVFLAYNNEPCYCNTYCAASATTGCGSGDEYISNVTFNTINNTSTCAQNGPGNYTNYTGISTPVTAGTTYTLNVTNGAPFSGDQCKAWFDWNADGDFTDAGEEFILTGSGSSNAVNWTVDVPVPAAATIGSTRMRVRLTYTTGMAPCGNSSFGEIEDYCITVNACGLPTYSNQCTSGDFIQDFTFGGFQNLGTGCGNPSASNYSDYLGMGPTAQVGGTYPVTIKAGPAYPQYYAVYIDFNDNGSYLDAGEFFNIGQALTGATVTANVVIPTTATAGTRHMRVRSTYYGPITAADGCNTNLSFGEIEDYNIYLFCPDNLAVNAVPIPNGPYNADLELTSTGRVDNATSVVFRAGNGVELQPNFETILGGVFEVLMVGCFP